MMIEAALRSIKRTLSALGLPLRDVRVPTRLQFQTTECGVAALNMVLSHHGLYLSNEEVRAVTGVSRDCVNAGEMARAARHYGMECKAYSREPDNLSDLPLPFLAHFRFIHFMVVEGFTAKDVLLCDPHAGRMRIPIEKFAEDFTGVVLSIKPGPNFIRSGADTHPVRSLLGRLGAPCKTHLIAALGLAMIAALLIPAWALLLGGWAGSLVETTGDWPLGLDAARFAPLALSVALLYCAISALAGHFTAKLQAGITLGQGELLARHFMALPASFFVYRLPSKLHEVIYSCEVVARSVCNEISPRLARLLALPACLIAMAWLNPLAALAVATLALMCLSGMEAVYQFRGDGSRRANLESGEQLNSLLFGREELEQSKLGGRDREFVISRLGSQTGQQKVIQEAGEAEALQSAIATAFAMGSLAIVLYVAAPSAHASGASLGATVAMILLALASSTALREFAALRTNWDKLLHMLLPVDDVQASKPTENSKSNFTVNANLPEGTVLRASGLTFGYSRTRAPLISDIGLELRLGEQLGLTGPSGGGKSTLAGLLAGDHQPWSGSLEVSPVLLDKNSSATAECATDTPAEQLAVRRNFVAWVDKSAFFFEGTVRENLCLWEADIPEERLQSAISDACLDDVIAARPGGLDAKVTERGGNFSGGQRQRLEIARALLREPTLLILDEATDALDPALEARVRENIRRRGCTLVMVSHRASTLAACDRVLRVVGGVISTEAIAASTANDATAVTAARADQAAESNSAPAGPPVIDTEVEHSIDLDAMGPALRFIANFLHARPIGNPNDNVTSPARNIASLAKTYGLHVRNERFLVPTWWRRSTDTVLAFRKNTRAPVVMMASNGGHRIVDPATSQDLQLGYEDLEIDAYRFYRRIDDDAQPTEAMLLRAARQHLAALLGAAAISTVLAVSLLLLPLVALRVFDPTGLFVVPGTASLALGLCALVAAVALLDYCHCIAPLRSGGMLELSFNAALVQRLPRLAPAFCVRTTPQSLGRALIAMQRLFARLRGEFLRRVANTATIVTSIALLTWIDASIAAIATLVALGAIVLPWLLTRQWISKEPAYEAQNLASRRFLIDVLNGIFRLRLLGSSAGALQRWIGKHSSDVILEKYVRSIECWRALLNNCYPLVGIYVVAVAGANFAATGPWLLPAVLLLAWALLEASLGVGAAMVSARRCAPWLEEANLLATAPIEPDSTVATGEPQRIELRDIAYRYAGTSVPALANISLNINRGEFIAITGPSGGGKSTLLRMLLGLDDPQAGAMLHNGAPITPAQRVAWRHGMGMVSQDERAHSAMTIRGQIAGSSPYGVKAVWEAVQTALLADDIHRMPMGLQTIVETGKISTGQEQRLLIARELLRQPSVLILDEATNAIPDSLQAELFANLRKIGLTCVLVTHRETAIEHMDRVLVLEGGRIEWSGTPAQLRNEERLVGMLRAERQEGHL